MAPLPSTWGARPPPGPAGPRRLRRGKRRPPTRYVRNTAHESRESTPRLSRRLILSTTLGTLRDAIVTFTQQTGNRSSEGFRKECWAPSHRDVELCCHAPGSWARTPPWGCCALKHGDDT